MTKSAKVLSCAMLFMSTALYVGNAGAVVIQNPGNGNFYEVVSAPGATWVEANAAAIARGGGWHLATITDASENAFIESLLTPGDTMFFDNCVGGTLAGTICPGMWIGGVSSSNAANDWSWVTGEAFSFSDWGPFEPFRNGDRIRIEEFRSVSQIAWNDAPQDRTRGTGYILETGNLVVPEPATLLLFGLGLAGLGFTRRRLPWPRDCHRRDESR